MSVTGIPGLLTSRQAGSPGADQDLRNNKRVELCENSLCKSPHQQWLLDCFTLSNGSNHRRDDWSKNFSL
jgi:hypothetical protein